MIVTNISSGCFYSSPQLIPSPSSVSVRGLDSGDWALDVDRPPAKRPPAVQLVALRQGWEPKVRSRDWRYIVIHHTATPEGDVEAIDAVHRGRTDAQGQPWLGIGYHFVIGNGAPMADGEVAATFCMAHMREIVYTTRRGLASAWSAISSSSPRPTDRWPLRASWCSRLPGAMAYRRPTFFRIRK
jgi:hypothetical protein